MHDDGPERAMPLKAGGGKWMRGLERQQIPRWRVGSQLRRYLSICGIMFCGMMNKFGEWSQWYTEIGWKCTKRTARDQLLEQ